MFGRKKDSGSGDSSGSEVTHADRMFLASESVYAAIERGEVVDVDAALHQAQYDAS